MLRTRTPSAARAFGGDRGSLRSRPRKPENGRDGLPRMRAWWLLAAVLFVPAANACASMPPTLEVEVAPEPCASNATQGCLDLPAPGKPMLFGGTVSWGWGGVVACAIDAQPSFGDVTITFSVSNSTPAWLKASAPPVTITAQEQLDPRNLHAGSGSIPDQNVRVTKSITVIVERRALTEHEAAALNHSKPTLTLILKATSSPMGQFSAGFATDIFRFEQATAVALWPNVASPLPLPFLALAVAALIARRS